jgi:periplasmic protein TonB
MTHALAARATSLGASLLVMGALVLAALTMTYTISEIDLTAAPPVIDMLTPPEPPPPPTPVRRETAPPLQTTEDLSPLPPLEREISTSELAPFESAATPPGPIVIHEPRWLQRPRNLTAYYPSRALDRNVEGAVRLDCLVRVSGVLDCAVVSESPEGWGFGEAAQRIARAHRMVPATRDGVAVEGRYAMRVPFEIE